MTAPPLVLVEPNLHQLGGHRHRTLAALAAAHGSALVVAPYGVAGETRDALEAARAQVSAPTGAVPAVLASAATAAAALARMARRAFASRCWPSALRRLPHQVTLVARCLTECACVRTGRRLAGGTATVVVLTASEALHGAAGVLGGPHIRFVHEVVTTEDAVLRRLGRLARRGQRRVLVLAPTDAVRGELVARFPHLPVRARPFAVADPDDRLIDSERRTARAVWKIPATEAAVCLVGGWWPYKDHEVLEAALARLEAPLHLLVAGAPLDPDRLQRWAGLPEVCLHLLPGPVAEDTVRAVYAAADATVVARRPGVGKESGLVVDAVRLGVPLIISEHDPALTKSLAGQAWVRTFPPGDSAGLAGLLRDLSWSPLPRPTAAAAAELGVPSAAEQIAFLTSSFKELL
ncbi:hypothetical protein ACIBL8_21395 [Streptomyces sp. NPDC050523]|uniref:hypothetical protein n=1 Tax=Streptomyces sp. NPDC050523 TaxID=3365622 RepID=UPI0037AB7408